MKEIEFIAFQLSKITNNVRYEFSEDYYNNLNNPSVGQMTRKIDDFFEDAAKYLNVCALEPNEHKEFLLDFSSKEMLLKAIPVLQSHDYIWEDDSDDPCFSIDEDKNEYRLFVHTYNKSAYSFIFGNNPKEISILRLSKLLKTNIGFSYTYIEGACSIDDKSRKGVAENGTVEFGCQITVNGVNTIEDIPEFNKQLYSLLDIAPDLKKFKQLELKLNFRNSR